MHKEKLDHFHRITESQHGWGWQGPLSASGPTPAVCAHFFLSHHRAPMKKAYLFLLCTLRTGISVHLYIPPKPSLLQSEQSQVSVFPQIRDTPVPSIIFVSHHWTLLNMSATLSY